MFFRLMFKVMRMVFLLIAIVLILLCILFAVLQTKWAKIQIEKKIAANLKDAGIRAKIEGLEGQLPFTWTAKQIDLQLNENNELKLSNIKFRFAILPLLKGRITINFLKVEDAEYSFLFSDEPSQPLTVEEAKRLLRNQLEEISTPLYINLHYFRIGRLHLINRENRSELSFGIAGSAQLQTSRPQFAFDLTLFLPDTNKTYLVARIAGNKKKDFISAELKMYEGNTPSFFIRCLDANLTAEMDIKGSWMSWKDLIYDKALTKGPLKGNIKGKISSIDFGSKNCAPVSNLTAHLMNRDWKFKAQFSLLSTEDIAIKNLLVMSDIIHIKGKAEIHQDSKDNSAFLAFSTPDLSNLNTSFSIEGSSKGKVVIEEGNFRASFEAQDLVLEHFKAGNLIGSIDGIVKGNAWDAQGKIDSADDAISFETSFNVQFIPNTLIAVNNFNLRAFDSEAHGDLNYNIADGLCDGTFFANVDQLEEFSSFVKVKGLTGEVAAECSLSSDSGEQNARCALVAKGIRYNEILLDDFSMYAEFENLLESPQGKFNFLLEKVYTPGFYLNRLTFGTKSDEVQWPFYFDAEGRIESPFECSAKGFWRMDISLFTLELTRFLGVLDQTPFSLKYPCELEWGSNYLNLSPFNFEIGPGNFFSTFELSPVRSIGQWELNHFPLEILNCFRSRFALNGFVSSQGYIDATPDNMDGVLNAVLEEANILHFGKKEPFQAKGSMQAHFDKGRMQIHTTLNATDAQFLDFNATLPIIHEVYPLNISVDKTKNTFAELLAEGKLQDLFDFVNLGTNNFTGLLSCHLFLSQTLSNPSLKGELELQNGTYDNYFIGMGLRNIDAHFEARNDEIRLLSLYATDDKSGEVTATGKILLEPEKKFPFSFNAEMKKLHAVGFDMIDCDLTGPLYLTGNMNSMNAQGNFLVDSAKIQITERLPYEIPTMPVTYINTPPHLAPRATSNSNFEFNLDLELTSEGNVRVEGSGLNAELEGNVHLYGKNTTILANGALKLIKGEYRFAGKIFKLTEGEVIFVDKPSPSSYLHLNGTLNLPSLTVTAMLRGPLTSPQLTFQSNPQKPTSSILALILFNKEISEISHPEAIQLATTLVSLSGGAGPDVLESIRKSIGIDRLNISSKPGSDEIAVQIGKYLTRGIMITLSQSATSSQVIVEVELPKGFVFQAETQEEGEGKFSLKWRKTY